MPSIHPDYEYDIFISYRHNDNQDGWVTRFVEALQNELKATLKNEVSIYFDKNPHDGLLETHQVDASLEKKLKCLVFIPIISQTYCDTSSFAWEHELLPFVEMAKKDELGMNITLSNGNVTSRVLPIKIHDLDSEDQRILESALDGPLRSIDFIYGVSGVNRPLRAKEDDPSANFNKTFYRDQINKVANSLKDIGTSILNPTKGKISLAEPKTESSPKKKSNNKNLAIGLVIIGIAMIIYWGYTQFFNSSRTEVEDVTIAVLAFDDQSPDGDQEWLGDGMADEILNVLAKVNGLQVTGRTSSFSFKGKNATIKEIGKALDVKTVLEGSISRVGNNLRITAQLIDVETDKHIWSKKYDRDWGDIHSIIDEVAQTISSSLITELSIEELEEIRAAYEVNQEAWEYYIKGLYIHKELYLYSKDEKELRQSEKMFIKAISIDSTFIDAYAGLADLYDTRSNNNKAINERRDYDKKRDSVVNIAYKINQNSAYLLAIKGFALSDPDREEGTNLDSVYYYYNRAIQLEPDNALIYDLITSDLIYIGLSEIVIKINSRLLLSDPLNRSKREILVRAFLQNGLHSKAKLNLIEIIESYPNNVAAYKQLFRIAVFYEKDINEANRIFQVIQKLDSGDHPRFKSYLLAMDGKKDDALSLFKSIGTYSLLGMAKETMNRVDSLNSLYSFIGIYTYNGLHSAKYFDIIRDEPRFKEILAKAKKVHEERVAKYGHMFDQE